MIGAQQQVTILIITVVNTEWVLVTRKHLGMDLQLYAVPEQEKLAKD